MELAGRSPEDSGNLKQGVSKKMDDVATANFLVSEIAHGKRHVGDMLHTAWKELNRRFPHRDEPDMRWTERRLRGWWNNESRIVRHHQMVELFETAEALKRARDEHAEYRAKTQRIRALAELVAKDEARGMAER
ncbi:hypothetical protein RJJ65_32235 [Rhizobium hidalgonense]|uniref:Uncharacterized protein n=1 Tax=Rhizobium hidalgonense TaxID=1538159 RepID=A0AAJ2LPQ4_9HYPH|nr:hypothetical protein [Rhizobium hidalgonense]MDR9777228.1 hypothetical protein [Rhizobium hidalgonense]